MPSGVSSQHDSHSRLLGEQIIDNNSRLFLNPLRIVINIRRHFITGFVNNLPCRGQRRPEGLPARAKHTRIMLTFPNPPSSYYVPAGRPVEFTVASDPAATFDVRILDAGSNELLGVRRFADTSEAVVDVAPCVARTLRFAPQLGRTGLVDTSGRVRSVRLCAVQAGMIRPFFSHERVLYPAAAEKTLPAWLSTMPRARLIARSECDELTWLSADSLQVVVTAYDRSGDAEGCSFQADRPGLIALRLRAADFPTAERIEVQAGACGTVVYTVTPPLAEGCRIAWRSAEGSVEHYTFPVEVSECVTAHRKRVYGPDGYTTTGAETRSCRRLRSAFETREVLDALAGILGSPDVWRVEEGEYVPVDVAGEEVLTHRHGTLSCMELEIRPRMKNERIWN